MKTKLWIQSLRRAALASVAVGLTITAGVEGCSSSSSSSGPPDPGHFASSMASSFCSALQSCCGAAKIPYDDGSCSAQMANIFQSTVDPVKRGKVVYNAGAVGACEQAIKDREAKCSADGGAAPGADAGFLDPITVACFGVFKGTVAPGDLCASSLECVDPAPSVGVSCTPETDRNSPNFMQNVCYQNTLHVLPGGACTAGNQVGSHTRALCESTLGYCMAGNADDGTGVCQAYANVGDNCVGMMTAIACNPQTSFCDFQTSTCAALPTAGQPCTTGQCAPGNYCDNMQNPRVCAAFLADGSACTTSQQCASRFCMGQTFDGGMLQPGTCGTAGGNNLGLYDIAPRTCGFGPLGNGPEDGGIVPAPKAQSLWLQVARQD